MATKKYYRNNFGTVNSSARLSLGVLLHMLAPSPCYPPGILGSNVL